MMASITKVTGQMKSNVQVVLLFLLLAIPMFSGNLGCTNGCLALSAIGDDSTLDESKVVFMSYWEDEACNSDEPYIYALIGECDDEGDGNRLKFIVFSDGFSCERRYFDFDSERTVAIYSAGDVADPLCYGSSYWPRQVNCSNGTVTEVLCGTYYEVGDDFPSND